MTLEVRLRQAAVHFIDGSRDWGLELGISGPGPFPGVFLVGLGFRGLGLRV